MRIVNRSSYSGRLLKSLIVACHEDRARTEGQARAWKALTITAVNWRGEAAALDYEGTQGIGFRLKLPARECGVRWLAYIVTWGLFRRRGTGGFIATDYEFAVQRFGATLTPEPAKPKARPAPAALIERRHAAAVELLAQWRRKATLAGNKVRKYTRAVARYEKLLAASRTVVVLKDAPAQVGGLGERAFDFTKGGDA